MATWGEILVELKTLQESGAPLPPGQSVFDVVRRKYLVAAAKATGRHVILYASKWTQPVQDPEAVSIVPEDVQGFMEVVRGSGGAGLDIILHSPGGSAEATEALVTYLRSKFKDIRVIVPHAAMSAATMLSCSANRIVMGNHSFLGPIDPQFILQTELGRSAVPAHAILQQFELAKKECSNQALLPAWLPMLRQYGPALIVQCQLAQDLSESLVAEWLSRFMFSGDLQASEKASGISKALANHGMFKSHGRFIGRDQAKSLGLVVEDLESNADARDAVLSVFHAVTHTFTATAAVKIIENNLGKAFIKLQQVMLQSRPVAAPPPAPPKPAA